MKRKTKSAERAGAPRKTSSSAKEAPRPGDSTLGQGASDAKTLRPTSKLTSTQVAALPKLLRRAANPSGASPSAQIPQGDSLFEPNRRPTKDFPRTIPTQPVRNNTRSKAPRDSPGGLLAQYCSQMMETSVSPTLEEQQLSNLGIIDSVDTFGAGGWFSSLVFRPTNPYEISAAILKAEADEKTIRAMGTGWSFSDAVIPQATPVTLSQFWNSLPPPFGAGTSLAPNFGYTMDTTGFQQNLQYLLPLILLDGVQPQDLFFVEAGIKIGDLNTLLDSQIPPVSLRTMGGSAGQSLAGAISTGTHGSDFDRPPLADNVRAIYLVGEGGTHHWIEPSSRPIGNSDNIESLFPCITAGNFHSDDDMFNAAVVAMGAMGVIYALVLDVSPQYVLIQVNNWMTWEALKAPEFTSAIAAGNDLATLGSGLVWDGIGPILEPFLASLPELPEEVNPRAVQVVVNPIKNDDGTHNCYATVRYEFPLQYLPDGLTLPAGPLSLNLSNLQPTDLISALLPQIMTSPEVVGTGNVELGVIAWDAITGSLSINANSALGQAQAVAEICKQFGWAWCARAVIDFMLKSSFPNSLTGDRAGPQINIGYKIMANSLYGSTLLPLQFSSIEAAFPFAGAIDFINSLLGAFDEFPPDRFAAGYVSLRACGPTAATLGMTQYGQIGDFPDVSGTVEMSLLGTSDDFDNVKLFEQMALAQGGVLHWGQSNGLLNSDEVLAQFPNLGKWKASQEALGGSTFTNLFMNRCGLV